MIRRWLNRVSLRGYETGYAAGAAESGVQQSRFSSAAVAQAQLARAKHAKRRGCE